MSDLPETILQFGAGNFLRAFADLFVHKANQEGQAVGRIVVVRSTGSDRAELLNERGGKFAVVVRGLQNGVVVDRVEECASISRAIAAQDDWPGVLAVARSPDLKYILSNTTEAGFAVDQYERPNDIPPRSFPAKLLDVLVARWQSNQPPVTIMPCELIDDNAEKLRKIVGQLAEQRDLPPDFREWSSDRCHWLSSLVDRIVPGRPIDHPLATEPLSLMCEPFAFWALQSSAAAHPWIKHPAILRTPDVKPYFLRKVRILNGAHTALVCKVGTERFATVLDAMNDEATARWLERLLMDEIVPTIADRVPGAAEFARTTLERFRNPYLRHRLSDIAVNHAIKRAIRLETTCAEYREKFGESPKSLMHLLAREGAFDDT